MKKLMIISAFAATSTVASAFDYKMNLEGRTDFVNANIKTTTSGGVTTNEKYNNFSNGVVRMNFMGAINDNLSYRARYRFIKSSAAPTTSTRENTESGVDHFYVDHKNSLFTARIGKTNWAEAAGRESFVSGTDVFINSAAFSNYKTEGDYRFGATAMFKFMETNSLNIAVSNPNTTFTDTTGATAGPVMKNTGIAIGAYYTGSFMDKLVQPVLAYTTAKQNGNTDHATTTLRTKDANNSFMSAGLKSEVAGFVIEADYKEYKRENSRVDSTVTAGNVLETTKSIYANVTYTIGDFTPVATYANDKFDSATNTADYKKNSFAVGTYWKPMADTNFRYHAMYTSALKKADGATSTVSKVDDKKFFFGIRADI